MNSIPRFSLVIPAYNEELYIPRLLESVEKARALYRGGSEAVEVIVADNCSTDDTAKVAKGLGCRVVKIERRAISAVRNAGARSAIGAVLAFVDADSQIHPDTFNAIDRVLAGGKAVAGATGVKLERMYSGHYHNLYDNGSDGLGYWYGYRGCVLPSKGF